jgi:hypothetical protein
MTKISHFVCFNNKKSKYRYIAFKDSVCTSREIYYVSATDSIFEVFTAVTMKNVVFWDIKPQFVLHRRHITSLGCYTV